MQKIYAFLLQPGDHFAEKGEHFGVISLKRDEGSYLEFMVLEFATGEQWPMTFECFDMVALIAPGEVNLAQYAGA